MAIIKRNGKFSVEVYSNGRRVAYQSGFATKREAKEWEGKILLRFRSGLIQSRTFTADDLFDKFEKLHLPSIRPNTQKRYEIDLRRRIRPFFRFMRLDRITPDLVLEFRSKIMSDLDPNSVNKCMQVLRLAFNLGVEWGMLEKNPYKAKPLKISRQKYSWWERWEDVQLFLIVSLKSPYAAAYRLALECGMRQGEIIGLSKQDVDFTRNQIHVHRQWLSAQDEYGPTKHNQERHIGFEPNGLLAKQLKAAILNSPDPEIIFLNPFSKRVTTRELSGDFQRLLKRHHLPRIRFHDLRHTFASWFMIRRDSIWDLMALLGHSNLGTTMRYAHLSKGTKVVPSFDGDPFTSKSRQPSHLALVKS